MWINIRTEFTFKQVYGHIDKVAERCGELGDFAGIADFGNTFGHVRWKQACEKAKIKPIYGVRLPVVEELQREVRRYPFNIMTFIARTTKGLQEIYNLVDLSFEQFYYRQRVTYEQVNELSDGVFVLSGIAPDWGLIEREVFHELGLQTPYSQRKSVYPSVACIDNYYPNFDDRIVYEPFADERLRERKTYPIFILNRDQWLAEFPGREDALVNLNMIANACNVELPSAPMVKYIGKDCIKDWCEKGAKKHGIDILNEGKYKERYKREIKLIQEKSYVDYFLVVADLIRYAKTKMAVGPSRGSSAGSLVCYLMGITEINPLMYDLYFERFIDINRSDLPDIDIDFQDDKRELCLKYLQKKYGKECVAQIGNVNRLKPKSAITRFADSLNIPLDAVQEVKDSILERSGGDARAKFCIEDSLNDSDVGKRFIEEYPQMSVVSKIEAHASHTGVHAAGVIVCNDPITSYCGVNSREKNKRIAMIDKKDAEEVNLLKIDALGLRTLSIIANVCDQIGKPYQWMYEIPLDDKAAYQVFNDQRYNGIFQFEGSAINGLAKQMPVENIEDIAALTALGRPGPLNSGGANRYIKFRTGREKPRYLSDHSTVVEATKNTFGTIVYQEQVMAIGRNYASLSWKDLDTLRRAMSKSYGEEFFGKYKKKFLEGALEKGSTEEEALHVWEGINTMGSYGFNKSHAVSYGLISYICAYLKAHYPLEFTVACLNHAKDDQSALKILRDSVEVEGIEYEYLDRDISMQDWSVHGGKLYGGLKTIHGIGPAMANKIVKLRGLGQSFPKGIEKHLNNGISTFKYLYPGKQLYGDYYTDPRSHDLNNPVTHIKDTQEDGKYVIIGCMIKKNLRDANEACFVAKRNGRYETGQTAWLNITLEDDTDSVMCKIRKEDYNHLGKHIAETGKENKDWYMVYGEKINGWSLIFVKNIKRITREI